MYLLALRFCISSSLIKSRQQYGVSKNKSLHICCLIRQDMYEMPSSTNSKDVLHVNLCQVLSSPFRCLPSAVRSMLLFAK